MNQASRSYKGASTIEISAGAFVKEHKYMDPG